MGRPEQLRRDYNIPDVDMRQEALLKKSFFETDKASFILFDAMFNDPYADNFQAKIEAAANTLTDDTIRDQLRQLTDAVRLSMRQNGGYFQAGKYYVIKAFPNNKGVQDEFGFEDYNDARYSQNKMINLMEQLCFAVDKYRTQLLAAGASNGQIDAAVAFRDDLQAKCLAQEQFKAGRKALTYDRVSKHNQVWEDIVEICRAGKIIFFNNYAKYNQYLLPASQESGESFSIKGVITNSETNEKLQYAEVSIVELNLDTNSDNNGKYGFGAIPDGIYTIQVQKIGYKNKTIENVNIVTGELIELDVQLVPKTP